MVAKTVMTVLCTAGITFYVRFLVALRKEFKPSFRRLLDTTAAGRWSRHDR